MPLPGSGALRLDQIATEFGGSTPHGLKEYYSGGSYVPAGTTGALGTIPSSGTISFNHFYGAQAVPPKDDFTIDPVRERDDTTIHTAPSGEYGWSLYGRSYMHPGWGLFVSGTRVFVDMVQLVSQEKSSGNRYGIGIVTRGSSPFTCQVTWSGGNANLDSAAVTSGPTPIEMWRWGVRVTGLFTWYFDLGTGNHWQAWRDGLVQVKAEKK